MKYKTLLFDVDDTLLDFKKNEEVSIQKLFDYVGCPLTEEIFERYKRINHQLWASFECGEITKDEVIGTRFQQLFKELSVDITGKEVENYYQEQLSNGVYMFEGAYELCETLSKQFDLYIVTNGIAYTQYKRLKSAGLDKLFKAIFVSEEVGYQKPDIQFFHRVFDQIQSFEKENTLIIGDSLTSDILGGNNAGIDTCWFNKRKLDEHELIKATYEIHSLNEILDIVY